MEVGRVILAPKNPTSKSPAELVAPFEMGCCLLPLDWGREEELGWPFVGLRKDFLLARLMLIAAPLGLGDVRFGSLVPECGRDADVGLMRSALLSWLMVGWRLFLKFFFGNASANFVSAADFVVPPAAREVC